jgi:hypothetical protein
VRKERLGAVRKGLAQLVLLELFAGNMLCQNYTPEDILG